MDEFFNFKDDFLKFMVSCAVRFSNLTVLLVE
jgi:hypothetical protein